MEKIKKIVWFFLVILLVFAPLRMIQADTDPTPWEVGLTNASGSDLPDGTIIGIAGKTMAWLLGLLGFLGIIGFVISGIMYLTAAGDEGQADRAKDAMKYSILGIIVALMGYVIMKAVSTWLNGSSSVF